MSERTVKIIAVDKKIELLVNERTTVEEAIVIICKKLRIKPTCRHLFGLRCEENQWIPLSYKLWDCTSKHLEARIRFRTPSIETLLERDINTFDYYFFQVRDDVLNDRVSDISYEKHKEELMGLGVSDMYRVKIEKGISRDNLLNDYKRYIPKEVLKHHKFFVKKPLLDSLIRVESYGNHDILKIKRSYLEQFEEMAPNYLSETYDAQIDEGGTLRGATVQVNIFHKDFPGIQYLYKGKKEWMHMSTIDGLCCISLNKNGTAEISRKTGIPIYLTMKNFNSMISFVTTVEGYYRLSVKWTFNICRDLITPSLVTLRSIKCHGPVGGKFSYTKLEQKRDNKPGCFILRECEIFYDVYYIDVCMSDRKVSTFKIERKGDGHYVFSAEPNERFESIGAIVARYKVQGSDPYFKECIPPSEYDDSILLLCKVNTYLPTPKDHFDRLFSEDRVSSPICIQFKHLQIFSGKTFSGKFGCTQVHKCLWKPDNVSSKYDVALKVLKPKYEQTHLKELLELAGKWGMLKSSAVVRLIGVVLSSSIAMVFEFFPLGPLNVYLQQKKTIIQEIDLVEAATYIANAMWHMEGEGIVHGYLRCHKVLVTEHTDRTFSVRVADPGIHILYGINDLHWIPPEHHQNPAEVKKHTSADMWALGTTLWQLFSYGKEPFVSELKQFYSLGNTLERPEDCSYEIYKLMQECWNFDPDQRKRPQAAMRDLNQLLYQVHNSRRAHSYTIAKVNDKNKTHALDLLNDTNATLDSQSLAFSATSAITGSTYLSTLDDFSNPSYPIPPVENSSSDISSFLYNLHFNTSADGSTSMTSIYEWNEDMGMKNVVLQGKIGQGCYGEVYKAIAESTSSTSELPSDVAVKKITHRSPSCLADFEREIAIMKGLKHPNIVEMKGVLQDPEVVLIMEYVPLGSLKAYISVNKERLLPEDHFLKYSLDVAEGMAYLGQQNIVHRDLAARNVLVANEYSVKISDFGLAQVMGNSNYYLLKTNRDLPIRWYAPESLSDGKFSAASDVWSYGVLLYEIFSFGADPILDANCSDTKTLLNLLKSNIRLPCPPKCPSEVYVDLMMECWKSDHRERPSFKNIVQTINKLRNISNG
uniref:Tyrosine-protein kinase n=3 Tax=Lygus hesperus TaxID=30085 RepID=A0A0A9ZBW4_LYGHE